MRAFLTWSLVFFPGLVIIGARIFLVQDGVLYGTAAVGRVDAIAAGTLALGAALGVWLWRKRVRASEERYRLSRRNDDGDVRRTGQWWTDWVAALAAFASIVSLAVNSTNLFQPAERTDIAFPSCPGVTLRNSSYVGFVDAEKGLNSRSGPSASYNPTGRFPKGCSLGFTGYCLGDSLPDATGTTDHATWVTNRWLLVTQHPRGVLGWLAQALSGESADSRFVSDAYITPETRYDTLARINSGDCPGNRAAPSRPAVDVSPAGETAVITAAAEHAVNMGFALWYPSDNSGYTDSGAYKQIFDSAAGPGENPGATNADGWKSVVWKYPGSLTAAPGRPAPVSPTRRVFLVVIPCVADNIPMDATSASVSAYDVGHDGLRAVKASTPGDFRLDQATRAACGANT